MMNSGFEELLGIDRGLRSSASASLQEDALRRAVTLYEKYGEREEILQALLLRLIDYFRICPLDARRIQLVDVLEQDIAKYKEEDETGHWQPIRVRGVGELARRLITQWESNDVLTRSLVVRLFRLFDFDFDGEKASHLCCSPTAASVYYRIAQSLQSRSPEEHLEALHTSISLARRAAPSFALYIVDAALDLLQDQYTLPAVQQSLLRLLYFAISDATAAAQVATWKNFWSFGFRFSQ